MSIIEGGKQSRDPFWMPHRIKRTTTEYLGGPETAFDVIEFHRMDIPGYDGNIEIWPDGRILQRDILSRYPGAWTTREALEESLKENGLPIPLDFVPIYEAASRGEPAHVVADEWQKLLDARNRPPEPTS